MENSKRSEISNQPDNEVKDKGFYSQLLEKRIRPHFRPGETLHFDEEPIKVTEIIKDSMSGK